MSIFIAPQNRGEKKEPKQASGDDEEADDGAYIYVNVYVYKLCVTYSICFKCQSYQF